MCLYKCIISGESRAKPGNRDGCGTERSSVDKCDERDGQLQSCKEDGDKVKLYTNEEATRAVEQGRDSKSKNTDETKEIERGSSKKPTEKPFELLTDGASLTLPSKYRKLKSQNTKLFSQLRSALQNQPVNHELFVERLESTFDFKTTLSHAELQQEATQVLQSHDKLFQLTAAAVTKSHALSHDASSPWQPVYKCYRLWQLVLSKFHELQRKTEQLLQGKEWAKYQALEIERLHYFA